MNFLTKNLGWILLLLFFIFMLFIISSNDPQKNSIVDSGSIIESKSLSGETDKNLDDLMKLIDNEELDESKQEKEELLQEELVINESETVEESISKSKENLDNKTLSGEITEPNDSYTKEDGEESKSGKGFFAKLFGGSDNDSSNKEETLSGSENILDEENEEFNVDSHEDAKESVEVVSKNVVSQISSDTNIIKSSSNISENTYIDTEISYPGTNLVTSVGTTYEVGVEMLKLNNKTFTQTLGLMSQGEKVKQLSVENSYGCFEVVVISTGMNGYVCKKYLAEASASDVSPDNTINEATGEVVIDTQVGEGTLEVADQVLPTVPAIATEIGSYYKVAIDTPSFFDVILERFTLAKGDILKQTSNPDLNTGCVEMKVVGTNSGEHDGKSVSICSPDMVSAM